MHDKYYNKEIKLLELDEKYAITKDPDTLQVFTKNQLVNYFMALSAFNILTLRIVDLASECFEIDCTKLCKKHGITYFMR